MEKSDIKSIITMSLALVGIIAASVVGVKCGFSIGADAASKRYLRQIQIQDQKISSLTESAYIYRERCHAISPDSIH